MDKIVIICIILLLFVNLLYGENDSELKQINKAATLITGTLIVGEALALYTGNRFLSNDQSWLTPSNNVLLGIDIFTGIGMLYYGFSGTEYFDSRIFMTLSAIAMGSHIYRDIQYYGNTSKPFCINLPLFVVNNIKILGLGSVIGTGIKLSITLN